LKKKHFLRIACLFVGSLTILQGCKHEDTGAFTNFKPLADIDKYVPGYYDASLGQAPTPKQGDAAVYVDFSDGMIQAYKSNSNNPEIIKSITQKLVSPSIKWYALGGGKIQPLDYSSNDLFAKVTNPAAYKDIMAPIEEALKQITSSNNDALLITDFEEYTIDKKEQFANYPKQYFIDWLMKGNSITFFYTNYHEKNTKIPNETDKHLYFTVFTQGKSTGTSLVSQIKDAFKDKQLDYKVFELNNNPYTVANNYGGQDKTGIADPAFAKWVNYNNNGLADKAMPYEVVGINKVWDDKLEKYVQNIIKKEQGLFMNKLFLDASQQSCFKLNKIAVKVYDVSDDYIKYAQCSEAKNHVPVLTVNEKKDTVWDDKSAKDAIIRTCYLLNTTTLKDEWVYKPTDLDAKTWPEVFTYDADIFSAHLKNSPGNIELKTVFHPNYKHSNIKKGDALLRVDYVIEDAASNVAELPADFQWKSLTVKEKLQTALYDAIRNTLQEPSLNPDKKIIYSYYIKLANTGKK